MKPDPNNSPELRKRIRELSCSLREIVLKTPMPEEERKLLLELYSPGGIDMLVTIAARIAQTGHAPPGMEHWIPILQGFIKPENQKEKNNDR